MSCINRGCRPSVKRLESHVMLSSAAMSITTPSIASAAPPIKETLTTDKSIYKVGEPIHITLTETNTMDSVVTLPSLQQSGVFTASRDLRVLWRSKVQKPESAATTLAPGQTRTISMTWNGSANVGSAPRSTRLTGTLHIDNTLANDSVVIAIQPRHGKGSNVGIVDALPEETLSLKS